MGSMRSPRAVLLVNGSTQIVPASVTVDLSRTQDCDTFSARVPMSALPAGMDINWWSTANDIKVRVLMSNDGPASTKMFDGMADRANFDFATRELEINGRDKTAALIDKKHVKKHQNQTPDAIVKEIAAAHGIEVDADALSDKAGKIYQIDYADLGMNSSEWTFIQRLAARQGVDAYATGGKVYFKKIGEKLPAFDLTYVPPTAESYAKGNFTLLNGSRDIILGRPCKCKVQSWNSKEKRTHEHEASEDGAGDPLEFPVIDQGLSQDQAQRRAEKHLHDTVKHEFNINFDAPGDVAMTPRRSLRVSGTGTAFDQEHEVATVSHRMGQDGYRMNGSTKAKSKKRGRK